MSQVFISYSRKDAAVVNQMVKALEDAGIDAWIDREDIRAGNSWRLQIVEAIDACGVFVLALSPNSAASDNVRKEIDLAQDSGRVMIPVILESVKIPAAIRYQLAGLQFIEAPLLGFEQALKQLVEVAQQEIAKKSAVIKTDIKKVELVIEGVPLSAFDEEKQKRLLEFVSQLTRADLSQLKMVSLTAGSVHAFVEMSAHAACQLKTFALNRDERFERLGVVALRLVGDAGFIHVASGNFVKTLKKKSSYAAWLGILSLLLVAAAAAGMFFRARPAPIPPQAETQPPVEIFTATLPPTSTLSPPPTFTATPTDSPARIDRCALFENRNIKMTMLAWYPGVPLNFYFKMTGGIPGLEDTRVGDGEAWNYSVDIAGHTTEKCEFIAGYKERLYCNIKIPSSYAYTVNPLTLSVSGCDTPIYENPLAEIPKLKITDSKSKSCGAELDASSNDFSSWCACMGGSFSRTGSCILP